ncbi:hypothetical protein [Fibrobacter sp.]|uniref:hypothetical protein n=1 Tax=Fibrobacter sp. TaxID=35828 RepID=UPI003890F2D5
MRKKNFVRNRTYKGSPAWFVEFAKLRGVFCNALDSIPYRASRSRVQNDNPVCYVTLEAVGR